MSNVNLPENPTPLLGYDLDFKKKAVFLSNVLSTLTGANKKSVMHYAENLQNNKQSYNDFVATVLNSYQGAQLSASGSGFNANKVSSAITLANEQTKTISAANMDIAYEKARANFSSDNFIIPINNQIIEHQKPKYLDFDKYKKLYVENVTSLISPISLTKYSLLTLPSSISIILSAK